LLGQHHSLFLKCVALQGVEIGLDLGGRAQQIFTHANAPTCGRIVQPWRAFRIAAARSDRCRAAAPAML
jgi:hypothetical protein